MDDLASTSELPVLRRPGVRRAWITGAAVLALVFVGAGIALAVFVHGRAADQRRALEQQRAAEERRSDEARRAAEHRARLASLSKAYAGLRALQSAADGGVTFVDYALGLNDAAATLEAYAATDDRAQEVRAHLAAALDQYRIGYRIMELMVEVGSRAESSRSWFDRYRRRHPDLYAGTATTGQDALQDSWRRARLELEAARGGLADYEDPRSSPR